MNMDRVILGNRELIEYYSMMFPVDYNIRHIVECTFLFMLT